MIYDVYRWTSLGSRQNKNNVLVYKQIRSKKKKEKRKSKECQTERFLSISFQNPLKFFFFMGQTQQPKLNKRLTREYSMNNIIELLETPLRTILFADDLSIHLETRNNRRAQKLPQEAIVRNSTTQPLLPPDPTQPPPSHGPDLSLPMPSPSLLWNTTVAAPHPSSLFGTR